eukprot:PhF_6_TR26178/c0_g1_i4/m.37206
MSTKDLQILERLSCYGWHYVLEDVKPGLTLLPHLIPCLVPKDSIDNLSLETMGSGGPNNTISRGNFITESSLQIRIAPTLLFLTGHRPIAFVTSPKSGALIRIDHVNTNTILSYFDFPAKDDKPGVVLKRVHFDGSYKTESSPLSCTQATMAILSHQSAAAVMGVAAATGHCSAMQKYIWSRGRAASVMRLVWNCAKSPVAYCLTNHLEFDEDSDKNMISKYLASLQNSEKSMKISSIRSAGAVAEMAEMTRALVYHLHHRLRPAVNVSEMIVDFIRDQKGVLWLLQVKGMKYEPVTVHITRPRATARMVSCAMCLKRYQPNSLNFSLSLKMMQDTEIHLNRHGVDLPWFRFRRGSAEMVNNTYESRKVCSECHALYSEQQKQMEVETAVAVGVGVTKKHIDVSDIASLMDKFKSRKHANRVPGLKSQSNDTVLNNAKGPTSENAPLIYRIFIRFDAMHNFSPKMLNSQLNLILNIPGRKHAFHIPIDTSSSNAVEMSPREKGGAATVTFKMATVRVLHLLAEEINTLHEERDSIYNFFERFETLPIELHGPHWCVKSNISFAGLAGGVVSRAEVISVFNGPRVNMVTLQCVVGIQLCSERCITKMETVLLNDCVHLPPE